MLTIDVPRAEAEVQRLTERLGVTVPEAIVIACGRLLNSDRFLTASFSHIYRYI